MPTIEGFTFTDAEIRDEGRALVVLLCNLRKGHICDHDNREATHISLPKYCAALLFAYLKQEYPKARAALTYPEFLAFPLMGCTLHIAPDAIRVWNPHAPAANTKEAWLAELEFLYHSNATVRQAVDQARAARC